MVSKKKTAFMKLLLTHKPFVIIFLIIRYISLTCICQYSYSNNKIVLHNVNHKLEDEYTFVWQIITALFLL